MNTLAQSVFIIEDERTISKLIEIKLEKLFNEVKVFSNGMDGYQAIKEHKPNLVILDVMLPGMQGFEILENIKSKEELSDIKVLMLTAKAREEDLERGFELQADEYMSKPFKMNELILRIRKLLK